MNRTAAFIAFVCLAVVLIVGVTILLLFRPEAVGSLVNLVGTVLALVAGFAVNFYQADKQSKQIEQVRTQTNGTLSAKEAKIDQLTQHLIANGINPGTGQPVATPVVATLDTVKVAEVAAGRHAGPLAEAGD